jgi:hypothetical protein
VTNRSNSNGSNSKEDSKSSFQAPRWFFMEAVRANGARLINLRDCLLKGRPGRADYVDSFASGIFPYPNAIQIRGFDLRFGV